MKFRLVLLAFLCSITLLTRAQTASENPLFRHIPADADRIFHINYLAISSKLDWQSIAAVMPPSDENKQMIAFILNPAFAGIDTHPGVIISETNILGPDSAHYTTILVGLTDSAKFLQLLKGRQKSNFTILPGKSRIGKDGDNTVWCWTDKLLVCVVVKAPKNTTPSEATRHRYFLTAVRKCQAALKGSDTNPFITNPAFYKGFSDDGDVHIWSQYGSGFGMMADAMRMSKAPVDNNFLKVAEQVKHSRSQTLSTLRFDNGAIRFHVHVFYDSTYNFDFARRPLNPELIEHLPQGNLLGMAAIHIDLNALLNLVQTQTKGKYIHTLDSLLEKKHLTTNDIVAAFKGDLVLAMIDSGKIIPATDTSGVKPGKPDLFLVVTVKNPAAFAKVLDALQKKDSAGIKKKDGRTLRNNIFVLGSTQQATDDYFDKPGRGPSPLVSDAFRSAPIAVAVDIKAISAYLAPVFNDPNVSAKNKQTQVILSLFDQVLFATARARDREMETLFEIKMTDSRQNSLTTISQLIKSAGKK